jgi:hypothetical protein
MKVRKILAGFVASAAVSFAAVIGIQAPAFAVQGYIDAPPGFSGRGWYAFDPVNDTLALRAIPLGIPAGYCLSVYLDPTRASGSGGEGSHYDIRMARTCNQNYEVATGLQYEGDTYPGVNLTGINKLAVCMAPNNVAITHPDTECRFMTSQQLSGVNAVVSNYCTRAWVRWPNAVLSYYGGGVVTQCDE